MSVVDLTKAEKNMISKPVFKVIDIDDIKPNVKNSKKRVNRNIDELCLNIKKCGLLRPLEVYEKNGEYILIGGERRYTAIKKLVAEEDYNPEVNCLVYKIQHKFKEDTEIDWDSIERLLIILSNAQEKKNDEEKVEDVKQLLDVLKSNPSLKPKGEPTVVWLAGFLGCSPRTAQKYKNMAEGKNLNSDSGENKNANNIKSEKTEEDYLKNLTKFFNQTYKKANLFMENLPEEILTKTMENDKIFKEDVTLEQLLQKFITIVEACNLSMTKEEE